MSSLSFCSNTRNNSASQHLLLETLLLVFHFNGASVAHLKPISYLPDVFSDSLAGALSTQFSSSAGISLPAGCSVPLDLHSCVTWSRICNAPAFAVDAIWRDIWRLLKALPERWRDSSLHRDLVICRLNTSAVLLPYVLVYFISQLRNNCKMLWSLPVSGETAEWISVLCMGLDST